MTTIPNSSLDAPHSGHCHVNGTSSQRAPGAIASRRRRPPIKQRFRRIIAFLVMAMRCGRADERFNAAFSTLYV